VVVSKSILELTRSQPLSASLNSLYLGLQLHLDTHLLTALQCNSEFIQSRTPISSTNWLLMAYKCISDLARSRPPRAYLSSLNPSHQFNLQNRSIIASKYISELSRSRPQSPYLSPLDLGLQVHLQTHLITVSKYIVSE
jgi:hypothetical protein